MGQFFLGESQSRIYPNVCQIWLRSDGRVGKKTDKGTLQLYIVDNPLWNATKKSNVPILTCILGKIQYHNKQDKLGMWQKYDYAKKMQKNMEQDTLLCIQDSGVSIKMLLES